MRGRHGTRTVAGMKLEGGSRARQRLLAGVPVTERRLKLAGAETNLLESGDGPPLVLLHGGIECGGAYWGPVMGALAQRNRVIAPDVPGLGESEPAGRLDTAVFADWLKAVIDSTCEEPPVLIAHSLLGTLAGRFAAQDGDSLRRLVIYAAPGVGPYRIPLGLRVTAIRFGLRPSEHNAERFDRWAFFDLDGARRRSGDWLDAFNLYTRARATVPHVQRTMRRLIGSCTKQVPDAELRRIRVPVHLLWARHDRFVGLGVGEEASRRLNWPLHVVEQAGHVPHIEQTEAFLRALDDALDPSDERSSP
jgi:2-hydroxymuconate-semialdehyde hydrolase